MSVCVILYIEHLQVGTVWRVEICDLSVSCSDVSVLFVSSGLFEDWCHCNYMFSVIVLYYKHAGSYIAYKTFCFINDIFRQVLLKIQVLLSLSSFLSIYNP